MSNPPGDEAAQYQTRPNEQLQADALPAVPPPPPPPGYGQPMVYQQVQAHSAALGVIASFFVPGLGSMLNEKVGKGIGILVSYIVAVALCLVLVGFVLAPAVWIWGMVAANNDAHGWNRAHGILS